MQAEKGTNKSSPDGGKASKKSMPKIPKTEDPESSRKGPTEKSSKGSKASAAQKGSVEKTGKPKGKAAKDAGKADKAAPVKRERKVYELPGQTKDTPLEVCFFHVDECCLDHTGFPERFLRQKAASLWVSAHGVYILNADTKPITQQMVRTDVVTRTMVAGGPSQEVLHVS